MCSWPMTNSNWNTILRKVTFSLATVFAVTFCIISRSIVCLFVQTRDKNGKRSIWNCDKMFLNGKVAQWWWWVLQSSCFLLLFMSQRSWWRLKQYRELNTALDIHVCFWKDGHYTISLDSDILFVYGKPLHYSYILTWFTWGDWHYNRDPTYYQFVFMVYFNPH